MLSRRFFLRSLGLGLLGSAALASYALAIEPRFRLVTTRYRLRPNGWPALEKPLRVVALADIHACEPWMPASRIQAIVETANELRPDLVVLLGDYVAGMRRFRTGIVPMRDWGAALARLSAPLGVYGILGNHDWWTDVDNVRATLVGHGVTVLENDARLLRPVAAPAFWLAGLGDQIAIPLGPGRFKGVDDLDGTMRQINDDSPVIMLAHEPDIFPKMPARVSLTLCGHTHGGQVWLPFLGRPIVPSAYGQRFAYGSILEEGRQMIVSGGLGCSIMPVRLGVPPEIVLVELG